MKDCMQKNNTESIATSGYVTRKRSFGDALAFMDIVQDSETFDQPLQVLLKKQEYYQDRSKSDFSSILKSIHPGTKIYMEGFPASTNNPGEVVLMLRYVRFLCVSRNPEHTKGLLQRINLMTDESSQHENNGLVLKEICDAMHVNTDRLRMVLSGQAIAKYILEDESNQKEATNENTLINTQRIQYSRISKMITENLPEDPSYPHLALEYKRKRQNVNSSGRQSPTHKTSVFSGLLPAPDNVAFIPQHIAELLNMHSEHSQTSVQGILDDFAIQYSTESERPELVSFTGWVQNRRRFQYVDSCISVLEVVEELSSIGSTTDRPDQIKCILHPDMFTNKKFHTNEDLDHSIAYGHLLSKGSQVLFNGILSSEEDRPILWISSVRITKLSWAPNVLKYFLDLISKHGEPGNIMFDNDVVACALNLNQNEAEDLIRFCQASGSTERQWKSAELSRHLQDKNTRMGTLTVEMEDIMMKLSPLREKYPLQHVSLLDTNESHLHMIPNRRKGQNSLRKSIDGSRWNRKKRPQLDWMISQIQQVCQSHPDFGKRPLNILDVGGGRGHLANYLASVLGHDTARVHVIDIDSSTIRNGEMDASRRNLNNVYFGVGDASIQTTVDRLLPQDSKYDVIVALHACGSLSDVALGHAVVNQASFVITPCCFRSNPQLKVLKRVWNDPKLNMVTPSEFLEISEHDRLALTSAAEIQGDIDVSGKAIHTLCAVRASAVERNLEGSLFRDVSIKTFPVGLSTRNYCIVGKIF